MPRAVRRYARIELRLTRDAKRKLERAAAYSDRALSDFVIDVALREADAIVRKHEAITLTAHEWDRFEALLVDPPKPNGRLRRAFADHVRVVRQ